MDKVAIDNLLHGSCEVPLAHGASQGVLLSLLEDIARVTPPEWFKLLRAREDAWVLTFVRPRPGSLDEISDWRLRSVKRALALIPKEYWTEPAHYLAGKRRKR